MFLVKYIFSFLFPCCGVHSDFRIKRFSVRLYSYLFCKSYLYLFMYTGVQHDLYIR